MNLKYEFKNAWDFERKENTIEQIMQYSRNYMEFLSKSKTERLSVKEIIKLAKENNYISIDEAMEKGSISCGDKIYVINKEKAVALFVIGKNYIEKGMKIIGSHIDSPRLDLKPNPLYQESNLGFFKTHYYGGIKKYQWTAIPLALHGIVILNDGTKVDISIGEEDSDPVFCVTDLLIHLAGDQMQKKLSEGISGEALNILIGNMPLEDEEKEIKYNNIVFKIDEVSDKKIEKVRICL